MNNHHDNLEADDLAIHCARCLHQLDDIMDEMECPRCGHCTKDWITAENIAAQRSVIERDLAEWSRLQAEVMQGRKP